MDAFYADQDKELFWKPRFRQLCWCWYDLAQLGEADFPPNQSHKYLWEGGMRQADADLSLNSVERGGVAISFRDQILTHPFLPTHPF